VTASLPHILTNRFVHQFDGDACKMTRAFACKIVIKSIALT
jgi:hypothetical protein